MLKILLINAFFISGVNEEMDTSIKDDDLVQVITKLPYDKQLEILKSIIFNFSTNEQVSAITSSINESSE